jgi:hypothetical protein
MIEIFLFKNEFVNIINFEKQKISLIKFCHLFKTNLINLIKFNFFEKSMISLTENFLTRNLYK